MTTNRRRLRTFAASLAAIGTAATVAVGAGSASASGLATVRLVNAGFGKNLVIAKAYGFFKKFGINAQLSSLQDGEDVLNALVSGSADIGYSDVYAGIDALKHNFKISLVAANNGPAATEVFLAKSGGPISSVQALKGKTVETAPFPLDIVYTEGFLTANGVNPKSVKLLKVANQPSFPEALQNGSADAIIGSHLLLYENSGQPGAYNFKSIGNGSTRSYVVPAATVAAWWSTTAYAKAHPQIENEFADALHAFNKWWQTLPTAQFVAIYKKYYGVDLKKLAGGSASKLKVLLTEERGSSDQTGAINMPATLQWYQTGLKYDPADIDSGVNLSAAIFESAKRPLPANWKPSK